MLQTKLLLRCTKLMTSVILLVASDNEDRASVERLQLAILLLFISQKDITDVSSYVNA